MRIKQSWWRRIDWWCVGRIIFLLLLLVGCFGWLIGFQRVSGGGTGVLGDGDLVIYEKVSQEYNYDDVMLVEMDGLRLVAFDDLDGGVVHGRVLAVLKTRGLVDE